MLTISPTTKLWFASAVDLRLGFDGLDPFAYLREALPGVFALSEKPTTEQVLAWLPDRWLLTRMRTRSRTAVTSG